MKKNETSHYVLTTKETEMFFFYFRFALKLKKSCIIRTEDENERKFILKLMNIMLLEIFQHHFEFFDNKKDMEKNGEKC